MKYIILGALFLSFEGLFSHSLAQTPKPDLIITHVEFKYVYPKVVYRPGQPVRGSDHLPMGIFYITVKNIGTAACTSYFYIGVTNSEYDIQRGRFSHVSQVNSQKNTIHINDTLVVSVGADPNPWHSNHFKFGIESIDELNFDNDTYECDIPEQNK